MLGFDPGFDDVICFPAGWGAAHGELQFIEEQVAFGEAEGAAQHFGDVLRQIAPVLAGVLQAFDIGGVIFHQQSLHETALAAEIMVEGRLGNARLVADLLYAGGIVPKGGKQDQGVLEDGLAVIHGLTIPYGIVSCQGLMPIQLKLTRAFIMDWTKIFCFEELLSPQ